jgi:DNA-binding CsgD family transcriptional regulator
MLTSKKLNTADLLEAVSKSVQSLKTHSFYASLIDLYASQVKFDYPQIWLFQPERPPAILYHLMQGQEADVHVDQYIAGQYEGDPCYQAWKDHNEPESSYRITELNKDNITQKNYLQGYYKHMNVRDEAGCLIQLNATSTINISLMRRRESPRFTDSEIAALHSVTPVIQSLVLKHWALNEHCIDEHSIMTDNVRAAMRNFGSSVLTDREHDVIYELLQGYGAQLIAERLKISIETLRNHRKNIYRKLDINSQPELFTLFIHSLAYTTQHPNQDPLQFYFSVPPRA